VDLRYIKNTDPLSTTIRKNIVKCLKLNLCAHQERRIETVQFSILEAQTRPTSALLQTTENSRLSKNAAGSVMPTVYRVVTTSTYLAA